MRRGQRDDRPHLDCLTPWAMAVSMLGPGNYYQEDSSRPARCLQAWK